MYLYLHSDHHQVLLLYCWLCDVATLNHNFCCKKQKSLITAAAVVAHIIIPLWPARCKQVPTPPPLIYSGCPFSSSILLTQARANKAGLAHSQTKLSYLCWLIFQREKKSKGKRRRRTSMIFIIFQSSSELRRKDNVRSPRLTWSTTITTSCAPHFIILSQVRFFYTEYKVSLLPPREIIVYTHSVFFMHFVSPSPCVFFIVFLCYSHYLTQAGTHFSSF